MKPSHAATLAIASALGGVGCDSSSDGSLQQVDAEANAACVATTWSWKSGASLPEPRRNAGGAVLAGLFYVVGGITDNGFTASVLRYDPAADTWQEVAPLPAARCCFATAVVAGRLYVAGGASGTASSTTDVFSYDPQQDAWRSEPSIAKARSAAMGASWQGAFAVIGGEGSNPDDLLDDVSVLDVMRGTWSHRFAPLPTGVAGGATVVYRERLFVMGGFTPTENLYGTAAVKSSDGTSWRDDPRLLAARGQLGAGTPAGCLVATTGIGSSAETAASEALANTGDAWHALVDAPTPRAGAAVASSGHQLFVAGGWQYGSPPKRVAALEILSAAEL